MEPVPVYLLPPKDMLDFEERVEEFRERILEQAIQQFALPEHLIQSGESQ